MRVTISCLFNKRPNNHLGKKFHVKYISLEELQRRLDPKPQSVTTNFYWEYMIEYAKGERFGFNKLNLNELCRTVTPVKMKEFLPLWWGKGKHNL